ncbi:MAG: nucleotidyltransferase domain-containing protein [Bacteroidetes bacterium]|nr:nucleotidyltransferase domain-containing protein [Bacteroidota bacterium]
MLDLPADQLAIVRAILAEHVPHANVWAFGSRVLGTAKRFSDLDLAVEDKKELSISTWGNLHHAFQESDLPISVDILDMRTVKQPFKRIVEQQRVAL